MRHRPRRFGAIVMALEAVDLYACVLVTTGAKMLLAGDARIFSICVRSHMTIDTALEAVLFGTNTSVRGFIALMKDELHVVTSHDVSGFHALFPLGLWDRGNLGIRNTIAGAQGHNDERHA